MGADPSAAKFEARITIRIRRDHLDTLGAAALERQARLSHVLREAVAEYVATRIV